jgi:hypothetical protein
METNPRTAVIDRPDAGACRHHWIIEAANGPTSQGRCKHCGAERDFFNTVEDAQLPKEEPSAALGSAGPR